MSRTRQQYPPVRRYRPQAPHVRFEQDLPIEVADGRGSYVLVAAYGDQTLEPVHPGRIPFGVTNPVFLHR